MSFGTNSGIAGFWAISVCQCAWLLGAYEVGKVLDCSLGMNIFLLSLFCFQYFFSGN